jgi:hypothetical protein
MSLFKRRKAPVANIIATPLPAPRAGTIATPLPAPQTLPNLLTGSAWQPQPAATSSPEYEIYLATVGYSGETKSFDEWSGS